MKRAFIGLSGFVAFVLFTSCPAPFNEVLVRQANDTDAPAIELTSPKDGALYDQTVTVEGTISDNGLLGRSAEEVIRTAWYRVGTSLKQGEIHGFTPGAGGSFSFSFSTSGYSETILVTIGVEDWNGNTAEKQLELLYPGSTIPSFAVTSGNRQVTVSWEAVDGADTYTLFYTDSGSEPTSLNSVTADFSTARTADNQLVVQGLPNGTLHAFKVEAYSTDGSQTWSSRDVEVIPLSAYTLSPLVKQEVGAVHIEWPAVQYLESYTVQRRPPGGSWITLAGEYKETVLHDSTARAGQLYEYRVTPVLEGSRTSAPGLGEVLPFRSESNRLEKRLAIGEANTSVTGGGYLYYLQEGAVQTVDISTPGRPKLVNSYAPASFDNINDPLQYTGSRAVLSGDHIYFNMYQYGLGVLDVTDPEKPVLVAMEPHPGGKWAYAVEVVGDYAYVLFHQHGLRVYDVADPSAPTLLNRTPDASEYNVHHFSDVQAVGNYLYASYPSGSEYVLEFYIGGSYADSPYLMSNRLNPASGELGSNVVGMARSGSYLLLSDWAAGAVGLIDVSSGFGSSPAVDGSLTIDEPRRLQVEGEYAYATTYNNALVMIGIGTPTAPVKLDEVTSSGLDMDFSTAAGHAFLSSSFFGLEVYDVTPLTAVDFDSPHTYSGVEPADMESVGDYVLLADADTGTPAVRLLQISDGGTVSHIDSGAEIGAGSAVAMHGDLAFVGYQDSSGAYRIDTYRWSASSGLTRLGGYNLGGSIPGIRALAVFGDALYAALDDAGAFVLDVSDPASLSLIEAISTGGSVQDLAVRNGVLFIGSGYIGGGSGIPNFSSYDLSDPHAPALLDSMSYWSGHEDTDGDGLLDSASASSSGDLQVKRLAVNDTYAYLTGDQNYGLVILNISDASRLRYQTHMPSPEGDTARPIPLDAALAGESVIFSDWDEENYTTHTGGHHVFRGIEVPEDPGQARRYQYEYYLGSVTDGQTAEYRSYADGRFFYQLHYFGGGLKFYPLAQ